MKKKLVVAYSGSVQLGGQSYGPGQEFEVEEKEAESLVARGIARYAAAAPPPKPAKPAGADLTAAIVAAIEGLDQKNEDDFSRSGLPNLAKLVAVLGYDITRQERDEAWKVFKSQR